MTQATIEHINLTVRDPDRSAQLLAVLFGWQERWRGPSQMGGWTIHVGDDRGYLALYTHDAEANPDETFAKGRPLNHLGVQVDDLDEVEARVEAAGLRPFNHQDYHPGRRFYFFDYDGIEFEVVSYVEQSTADRHLSSAMTLEPGDLIFNGTPARRGDKAYPSP